MYKWTTTTIINSNEDFSVKGSPLFSGQAATTSENGREIPANLFVKRVAKFNEPNVKAIYVRRHNDAELAQAKIDLSGVTDPGVYRIAVYIGLQGSENEYYANDFPHKGKPFFIEFEKTENAGTMTLAEKVVKIAKKYQQMVYEIPLLKVTSEGNTVVLEAIDEYQRFRMLELQKYDDQAGLHQSCCSNAGDFVTIDTMNEDSPLHAGKITIENEGKEGFGTYRHLIKDLRLPTMENRRWGAIIADETPIVGATYDEYIIHYCTTVGVQGLAHVGDMVQAATTHVFYVNTALKNDWEAALANIGTLTEVDGENATIDPYKIKANTNGPVVSVNTAVTQALKDANDKIAALEKRVEDLEA